VDGWSTAYAFADATWFLEEAAYKKYERNLARLDDIIWMLENFRKSYLWQRRVCYSFTATG
jgi:hypothetical protein